MKAPEKYVLSSWTPSKRNEELYDVKEKTYSSMGQVSDGYHTFDELYHYRMLYNAGFLNELYQRRAVPVYKSWRHSDEKLCFGGGWFVVVALLPTGQVTNHYPAEHWDLFDAQVVYRAPEWDGHTPKEAAKRIEEYLKSGRGLVK